MTRTMVRRELLEARARDAGREGERARLRLALGDARGRGHALGGRWWNRDVPGAMCVPAVLIDVDGELTVERAAEELEGWALIVRGATAIAEGALAGRPAGGCEGELDVNGEVPWIVGLTLHGIRAGARRTGHLAPAPTAPPMRSSSPRI